MLRVCALSKMRKTTTSKKPKEVNLPMIIDQEEIVIQKKHRCEKCNKLLGIENLHLPSFDIKCVRCGHENSVLKDYNRQIIITDKTGKILYINSETEKATGYSAKEVLGKTPAIWGNQMSRDFYKEMWNKILVKKQPVIVKVTNKHKAGYFYQVVLRISPILDVKGDVEFFIGMETIMKDESATHHN